MLLTLEPPMHRTFTISPVADHIAVICGILTRRIIRLVQFLNRSRGVRSGRLPEAGRLRRDRSRLILMALTVLFNLAAVNIQTDLCFAGFCLFSA